MRLEEALDALPPWRWYERLGQRIMNNFASLQAAPVAACLLLLAGVGAGSLGEYKLAGNRAGSCGMAARVQAQPAQARRGCRASGDCQHFQHCAAAEQP
jgi:hypothetical protein